MNHRTLQEYLFLSSLLLVNLCIPYLLVKNHKKQKAVTNEINNKSYSVITIWMLKVNSVVLVSQFIINVAEFILIMVYPEIVAYEILDWNDNYYK